MQSEITELLNNEHWIIFSAQNPDAKKLDDAQNEILHQDLIRRLDHQGRKYEEVYGRYSGNKEKGVFLQTLVPADRQIAASFARHYGQESVLTSEGLVYQDGSLHPTKGIVFPLSEPEDNFSLLRSTYFYCDIDFDRKVQKPQ